MRIRTGHGPNDWTPSIPASSGSYRITGSQIVSAPGAHDRERLNEHQRKHKAKLAAEKAA